MSPEGTIADITMHPTDAASLVGWILRVWDKDPELTVIVLTMPNDASELNSRVRVKLSEARRAVKMRRAVLASEFGINTAYFPWTRDDGEKRVAVCFTRFQSKRHKIKQAIAHSPTIQAMLKQGIKP